MQKNSFFKSNRYYLLSAAVIYLLILIPSLYTPFQSDDYSYFLQGIDLVGRWNHYIGWSGRLVTDFTSSALLTLFPRWLYQSINAFVFLVLCISISLIPMALKEKSKSVKTPTIILWVVFFSYWLANPRLGETSFWLVGSANYLWPIMWAGIYICCLLFVIRKEEVRGLDYLLIFVLGILAGCSNENTGVTIVFFTFITLIAEKNRKIILLGLMASLIGAAILILAPGNFIRQQYFTEWYDLSTLQQLGIHLLKRMPKGFAKYWYLIILFVILYGYIRKQAVELNKRAYYYILLFIVLSFFANLVLAIAPYMSGRNLNTGLFFLLPALAILCDELFVENNYTNLKKVVMTYSLLFFIPSYLLFTNMMYQAYYQQEFREEIILNAKADGLKDVEIPEWYFTIRLKGSDKFDTFRSGAMPSYYGVDTIEWKPVNFNYASLYKGDYTFLDKMVDSNIKLKGIYKYRDYFFIPTPYFVLEFDQSLQELLQEGESVVQLELNGSDGKSEIIALPIDAEVKVGNGYFYKIDDIDIPVDEIMSVNLIERVMN